MRPISREQKLIDGLISKADDLMADWSSSRNKQKKFVLEYIKNGFQNGSDAARKAGYSAKMARVQASRMITNANTPYNYQHVVDVVTLLQQEFEEKATELSIANSVELQQFWTEVMLDPEQDMNHRLKASELQAKAKSVFVERVELSGGIDIGEQASFISDYLNGEKDES